jgi:hypothetical protein
MGQKSRCGAPDPASGRELCEQAFRPCQQQDVSRPDHGGQLRNGAEPTLGHPKTLISNDIKDQLFNNINDQCHDAGAGHSLRGIVLVSKGSFC